MVNTSERAVDELLREGAALVRLIRRALFVLVITVVPVEFALGVWLRWREAEAVEAVRAWVESLLSQWLSQG